MNKLGAVAIIIGMVIACYLIMLVVMPVLRDFIGIAHSDMSASVNMTDFPGTSALMLSTPWILWFVPACIGMIAIVVILRRP